MSLPPAPKDISTHPKKGSVVSPTNREVKERDVDRNMRLYAVITALREGKLPSNAQISKGLKHLLATTLSLSPATPTTPVHRLSPAGKKLVGDCHQIIESLRTVIDEKNADELVQDFVFGLQNVETQGLKDNLLDIDVPVPPNPDLATKHLRTLLTLLLSNAEARKLVTDLSIIGRDLIARSAGAAAKHVAPSPEALANVDKPAEGDSFVGGGKGKEAEVGIPGTGMRVKQSADDELGKGVRLADDNGESATAGEMRDIGVEGVRDVVLDAGEQAKKKRGVVDDANASDVTDRLSKGKERVSESVERGKQFLSEEYFPKERRDQFVFRCKKVILELQNHEDYQESIKWLIGYVEDYVKQGRTAVSGEGGSGIAHERVGEGVKRSNLSTSLAQLRTILERFANNVSMDVIFDSINALTDDARRDEALWTWWTSVGLWLRKVLLQAGYVIDDECTSHAKRLIDLGKEFYEGKYREHFEMLFDSVWKWAGGFGDDPVNKQFASDWARLTKDLLFDGEGNLKFKPELWDDIRRVVLPGLIDQVGYIPIPRIEYSDDGLDLVIENLTLQGRNLFPNFMSVDINNYIRFSPYTTSTPSSSHRRGGTHSHADSLLENDGMMNTHRVKIHLEQMQADMRDVTFWYRKKKGIPRMSDSGVADVVVGGRGLSVIIDLVSTPPHERNDNDNDNESTGSLFQTHSINVKLDSLKFAIRDSNHDFLYKTLRPLATGLVKRQIEKAVTEAVGVGLGYVDGWLVGVRERMRDVKEGTKEGVMGEGEGGQAREEVLRDIFARTKNAAGTQHDPSSAARAGAGEAANTVKEKAASATKTKAHTNVNGSGNADTSRPSTISRASLASSASSPSTMKTKKRQSQFRIVGDKRNSMFVDHGGFGVGAGHGSIPMAGAGPEWVNKGEERKGVVGSNAGKGWMSDAFQFAG